METTFTVTCVKSDYGDFFTDFGIHKDHAHIWGVKGEDVLEVKMCVSENQSPPDWNAQEYWDLLFILHTDKDLQERCI